eukprot:1149759-Pelagomonas_calceolata.AAC.3
MACSEAKGWVLSLLDRASDRSVMGVLGGDQLAGVEFCASFYLGPNWWDFPSVSALTPSGNKLMHTEQSGPNSQFDFQRTSTKLEPAHANKLVTATRRGAIKTSYTSRSQVLEPGASNNPPDPPLHFQLWRGLKAL